MLSLRSIWRGAEMHLGSKHRDPRKIPSTSLRASSSELKSLTMTPVAISFELSRCPEPSLYFFSLLWFLS